MSVPACHGSAHLFFIPLGSDEFGKRNRLRVERALAICGTCSMLDTCRRRTIGLLADNPALFVDCVIAGMSPSQIRATARVLTNNQIGVAA